QKPDEEQKQIVLVIEQNIQEIIGVNQRHDGNKPENDADRGVTFDKHDYSERNQEKQMQEVEKRSHHFPDCKVDDRAAFDQHCQKRPDVDHRNFLQDQFDHQIENNVVNHEFIDGRDR